MQEKVGKFKFTVPEGHADQGKEIEKPFTYQECDTDEEANAVLADEKRGLSLRGLVNDKLRSNARSNAYQTALAPYRPSEVSPEDIKERTIRDLVRLGLSEESARAMVTSSVAAASNQSAGDSANA